MPLFSTYFCIKYFLKYNFPIFDVWGNKKFMVSRNIYIISFLFYYEIVFGSIIFANKNMFGAIKDSACVSYTFLTPVTPLHFHYYQSTMNSLSPMLHYFYAAVATSLPLLLCIATILFGRAGSRPRQVRPRPKAPPKNKIFLGKKSLAFHS